MAERSGWVSVGRPTGDCRSGLGVVSVSVLHNAGTWGVRGGDSRLLVSLCHDIRTVLGTGVVAGSSRLQLAPYCDEHVTEGGFHRGLAGPVTVWSVE